MVEDLYHRVTKLEAITDEHSKKLDAQASKNETLTKLTVLMERQMEDSKERERRQEIRDDKQNEQMEKFSNTLSNIDNNLRDLNVSQKELKTEVTQIGDRVTYIEAKSEEKMKTRKQRLIGSLKYIGSIFIGISLAYLYKIWGL